MKRLVIFVTITLFGLLFQGCDYLRTLKTTYGFLNSKLVLSSKMIKVADGRIADSEYSQQLPVYVIYYSPDVCSECAINHIFVNKPYYDFAKRRGDFETIIIVAPPEDEFSDILTLALKLNFPYPIYFDSEHHLEKQDIIPQDERFHCFLLDKEGIVSYIGRPLSSLRAQQQFIHCLTK